MAWIDAITKGLQLLVLLIPMGGYMVGGLTGLLGLTELGRGAFFIAGGAASLAAIATEIIKHVREGRVRDVRTETLRVGTWFVAFIVGIVAYFQFGSHFEYNPPGDEAAFEFVAHALAILAGASFGALMKVGAILALGLLSLRRQH